MKTQHTIAASLLPAFVGVFLVIMTVVFLTVPYALSNHPGDPAPKLVSTESIHLT